MLWWRSSAPAPELSGLGVAAGGADDELSVPPAAVLMVDDGMGSVGAADSLLGGAVPVSGGDNRLVTRRLVGSMEGKFEGRY